jgi:hypothetical protein
MRLRWSLGLTLLLPPALAAGCADTTDPLPPADEVLLVVNSTESSLSIIPVESPGAGVTVPLGGTTPTPVNVAALDGIAIVFQSIKGFLNL